MSGSCHLSSHQHPGLRGLVLRPEDCDVDHAGDDDDEDWDRTGHVVGWSDRERLRKWDARENTESTKHVNVPSWQVEGCQQNIFIAIYFTLNIAILLPPIDLRLRMIHLMLNDEGNKKTVRRVSLARLVWEDWADWCVINGFSKELDLYFQIINKSNIIPHQAPVIQL